MKRPLIYLSIFTVFFWTSWFSLAYLTAPIGVNNHYSVFNISLFLILFFAGVVGTIALILSIYKTVRPNRKLPALLIKDSLNQGFIVATWLTGLLMLQLLRSASVVNVLLWLVIFAATEWTQHLMQRSKIKSQSSLDS